MNQKFFQKEYVKKNLLDSNVEDRINLINNFDYDNYKALVKTEIYEDNDKYIYRQILYKNIRKYELNKEELLEVAKSLEYLNSIGFVHGDINRKNIIYTKEGFKIIDYEPSLLQIKNKKRQLMITLPYVDKKELKKEKITSLTDKIGFFYFIVRNLKKISALDIVCLSHTLEHTRYIKENLNNLNYFEILELAFTYK